MFAFHALQAHVNDFAITSEAPVCVSLVFTFGRKFSGGPPRTPPPLLENPCSGGRAPRQQEPAETGELQRSLPANGMVTKEFGGPASKV